MKSQAIIQDWRTAMFAERISCRYTGAARTRALILRGIAAVVVAVAWSAPVAADPPAIYERFNCKQWSVEGEIALRQTNNSSSTVINVTQRGARFEGTGSYGDRTAGNVRGTMSGNTFEATIHWSNGSIGVYQGQINGHGLLSGHSYDETNPASRADFSSTRPFQCAKPTVALGRVQTTNPDSTSGGICELAKSARGRGSPAAASLEKQCREYKVSLRESTPAMTRFPASTGMSVGDTTATSPKARAIKGLNTGESTSEIPAALMPGGATSTPWASIGEKTDAKYRPRVRAQDPKVQTDTTLGVEHTRNQMHGTPSVVPPAPRSADQ